MTITIIINEKQAPLDVCRLYKNLHLMLGYRHNKINITAFFMKKP